MSETRRTDSALDLARCREAPTFFIVDRDLRVAFHPANHVHTMGEGLPAAVVPIVRELMSELAVSPDQSALGIVSPTQVVRLLKLEAKDGADHYAVLLERFAARNSAAKAAERFGLSKREAEVLEGLMRGESTNEIARRLGIAATTVQEHVRKIGHKTNVTKRSEIVATVFGLR